MSEFRILGTNHTSFTVSDLDRSIALYSDALGFAVINRGWRDPGFIEKVVAIPGADIEVAYLQAPGHRLELIQYHGPAEREKIEVRPCDVGFAHIAFDVDDLDAALTAARRAGLVPLGPPQGLVTGPNAGGRIVYCRDFDAVTIEFIEKPKGGGA